MSTTATDILEQFRKLPLLEQRELVQVLLKATSGTGSIAPLPRRRSVAELKGFEPTPCDDLKDHDRWFAEAILVSKKGDETP